MLLVLHSTLNILCPYSNAAVAEDLSKLSSVIKGGKSKCDAVKALLEDNVNANLNEDVHSDEWQAFNEDSGAAIRARCEAAGRRSVPQ